MGNTVTRVKHDTGGTSGGVQGQHSLDRDVHGWGVEGLEHDLGHLLSVALWVQRGLREQDRVLVRGHTKLVVEGVVPDLLHVVPVGDPTVLDRVLEREDTSLGDGLLTHIRVSLSHTDHDTLVSWSSYDTWEDGAWGVVPSETGLNHTATIVTNNSTHFAVVSHVASLKSWWKQPETKKR